jgi:hypothetical protein
VLKDSYAAAKTAGSQEPGEGQDDAKAELQSRIIKDLKVAPNDPIQSIVHDAIHRTTADGPKGERYSRAISSPRTNLGTTKAQGQHARMAAILDVQLAKNARLNKTLRVSEIANRSLQSQQTQEQYGEVWNSHLETAYRDCKRDTPKAVKQVSLHCSNDRKRSGGH